MLRWGSLFIFLIGMMTSAQADDKAANTVVDLATLMNLDGLVEKVADKQVVFVGESHDQYQHHLNQLAMETGDTAARSRMYRRMQDLMEESGCYRFITNGVMPQIVRDSIEPVFRPDGYALLRDFRPGKQAG